VVLAALAMICGPTVALAHPLGASSDWTLQESEHHPPASSVGLSMAADPANGTVVLFGGPEFPPDGVYTDDTWTWDRTHWTLRHPAHHPSARGAAAMAFDPGTGTVVLFGGWIGIAPNWTYLGDTWTWDGNDWTQRSPAHQPGPRVTSMATDPATDNVLLQGGQCCLFQILSDTWTWDGSDWTQQTPAHQPPTGASLASDPATDTVVSFGGGGSRHLFDETWTWDGRDWTQQTPAHHPSPRTANGLAFDPATETVVLFGGELAPFPTVSGETWTWDGRDWTQRHLLNQPSPRRLPGMATDPATCSVVLFGGEIPHFAPSTLLGDTWVYASSRGVPDELDGPRADPQREHEKAVCAGAEARLGL
jgi:hypothetical protein